jgi:tRNA threonylcarbamoyladenosine biosynthesis protein TsaE
VVTYISDNPSATESAGRELATHLPAGSVVALTGPLGAGKTRFVKGLAAGMGTPVEVSSPTFTLVHEYMGGRVPVYHFDFFRIEDRPSAERLGLDEYFFGDGICVVEWADKFADLIPANARWVSFETKSETERKITIS